MNFFLNFPKCSLPSTVSKKTKRMISHHSLAEIAQQNVKEGEKKRAQGTLLLSKKLSEEDSLTRLFLCYLQNDWLAHARSIKPAYHPHMLRILRFQQSRDFPASTTTINVVMFYHAGTVSQQKCLVYKTTPRRLLKFRLVTSQLNGLTRLA